MLTVVKMDGATKDNVSVLLDSLATIATISANRVNGAIIVVKNVTVARIRHVITSRASVSVVPGTRVPVVRSSVLRVSGFFEPVDHQLKIFRHMGTRLYQCLPVQLV